jgi:hypothetical protein
MIRRVGLDERFLFDESFRKVEDFFIFIQGWRWD